MVMVSDKYFEVVDLVSVPSFGDSFFMVKLFTAYRVSLILSFRPLIRGFFFYKPERKRIYILCVWFPSPHSGILFLCTLITT